MWTLWQRGAHSNPFEYFLAMQNNSYFLHRRRFHGLRCTISTAGDTIRFPHARKTTADIVNRHAFKPFPSPKPYSFYCHAGDSDVNPLAADRKLRKELLEVGPYCINTGGEAAYCSPNASRTQRSGVEDIKYMNRPDRHFCEFKFARQRLTPEAGDDIEACRSNLTMRIRRCHLSCDSCAADCTSLTALLLVSAYKCSLGLPTLGLAASFHSSDIGTDISHRWGAKRIEGRPPAPGDSFQEQYRTMVQNRIDNPIAPRNCKSLHLEPVGLCVCVCVCVPMLRCHSCIGSDLVSQAPPRVHDWNVHPST